MILLKGPCVPEDPSIHRHAAEGAPGQSPRPIFFELSIIAFSTVCHGLGPPGVESAPGKKLTDRWRWPAVTQDEVLILTRDIMSLQSY